MSTAMAEISLSALVPRAKGPVASVFLMAPPAGGRTTAVKVYPQPLDRRTYAGIETEQAKLAGLRSARSIVLVDSLDELPDGRTGLRMEFCPQSLPDLVSRGPLPIGDVIVLGQILASVLAEAHELGLVHGGVTPANVLERASGQPALSDFGTSLRLRFPRDLMVDAAYTAPEVLRDGELSEQADVYGLAAVLQLALTASSPFPTRTGETLDDVVLRVLREPAPPVSGPDVPSALTKLLQRMLAKEPLERPDAAEVARALEVLLLAPDEAGNDLDFDDFRDELATARVAQIPPPPAPIKRSVKKAGRQWKKPSKSLVIAAAAVVALLAVVPVMMQQPEPKQAGPAPAPTTPPIPVPTATESSPVPAVRLELKPPKDNGTSVVLEWTSSKPLVYAVYLAEQGGKGAQTTYKGRGTSMTVKVIPGLKYCFEVQGTDATAIYVSKPQPIRGATCQN
ncbi:protein kinase [Kribbella sp. NPDC056861]|uniref:serine/threonine protein kinase n=1 Tax=Kribbella sp. NPDC056861 TaxID=3154857 RepID=UPI0034241166